MSKTLMILDPEGQELTLQEAADMEIRAIKISDQSITHDVAPTVNP